MHNYKELKVWQKSMDLTVRIFEVTKAFPKEEMFGLTSQIRRAAVSIPSNIAEGAGRNSKKDFKNFLGITNGSACELETQLMIAHRVNFLDKADWASIQEQISEIQKMNWALMRSISG
jgi:four helix bundle protein